MLYLHCGWPRTSTTTLQTALFENSEALAAAGIVFPDRWLAKWCPTHHGVVDMLGAVGTAADPFAELSELLAEHADRDVILSAEFITMSMLSTRGLDAFLALLATAGDAMPVRCVWTLRRFDAAVCSYYLRRTALGKGLPPPPLHLEGIRYLGPLFAGMRRVEEVLDGEARYVRYEAGGEHNLELLRALGVPAPVRESLRPRLMAARLNASPSHKQAVAMLNLEKLSARAGMEIDGEAMRRAFHRREFHFERDWPCRLVGGELRRSLHERALAAAREQGFRPYVELFGDERVEAGSVDLGLGALADEDVDRLAVCFGRAAVAGASPAPGDS